MRPQMLVALLLGATGAALWLAWPWLMPLWRPAPPDGADLVVVLDDGVARLATAERIEAHLPQPPQRLLIRSRRGAAPLQPMPELLKGFDAATQITALAHWLRRQPPPRVARVWIRHRP
jgi:hypothetical protein